ncbi:ribonuclease Z [Conexibacter woesei]|uniref:Ribonuclease Z n=1 Tax=Conexibacter woesei (strain DSM 14684 / CCUG 47730 / CIP 108061 / JCM 11494 / NBRC 100937 / ID131577) TaxID=469383 RepID=D3FE00_CONWI|nr:ribonuclease Z [Conexibacter woesei]ADB51616.1 ribonuclease Z [Conexibacter woesei DSM 14684]
MDLSLFFAGTAGSVPTARRGLPAILLRRGADRILFDCGEGTQRQLLRSAGLADLTDVFITHFHADHWLGLPGMLKTFDLRARDKPLTIHGPPGLRKLMNDMRYVWGGCGYEITLSELPPDAMVERDEYVIEPFLVNHRGTAYGYVITEDDRPGRFDAQLAEQLGVTPGPDFGRLQRGETIGGVRPEQVIGETRLGRKLVISGDTGPCEELIEIAHGADVLVHEATFTQEEADRARQTQHSTAAQAAKAAVEAEVRLLALVHLSTRYGGREIREEARAVFPATVVPRDFDAIDVPLPERGAPELVRWDGGGRPLPREAAAEVAAVEPGS